MPCENALEPRQRPQVLHVGLIRHAVGQPFEDIYKWAGGGTGTGACGALGGHTGICMVIRGLDRQSAESRRGGADRTPCRLGGRRPFPLRVDILEEPGLQLCLPLLSCKADFWNLHT